MSTESPRRIWLVSYPRTASNLLLRILALDEQPNVLSCKNDGYFFESVSRLIVEMGLRTKPLAEWPQEGKDRLMEGYQSCFNKLLDYQNTGAAQSKTTFFKEHVHFALDPTARSRYVFGKDSVFEEPWKAVIPGQESRAGAQSTLNHTVFPDEFIMTLSPIFLIRHPALAVPSFYRAYRDLFGVEMAKTKEAEAHIMSATSLNWPRRLYEWYILHKQNLNYCEGTGVDSPIVIDADDYINDPGTLPRVCEILGLDASKLRFTWHPVEPPKERTKRRMHSTLCSSSGVLPLKTSLGLDIDNEAIKWKDEFGEDGGAIVEKFARASMEDYEYLKAGTITSPLKN